MNKQIIYPQKLKIGDEIRIVAPSLSLNIISPEVRTIANQRFDALGLKLSFSKNVEEIDEFNSSSIQSRVDDLHKAFKDKKTKAILTVIGGFNCNQLLKYLDWKLIKDNPKIFCGYSDTTALNNAIFAKTGLVTYSGPCYSAFGQKLYFDYTLDFFKKCLFSDSAFTINTSEKWSDDLWYIDQQQRKLINNNGFLIINEGVAGGAIIGANLCTLNLLQGTEYFPSLKNSILFLEDDSESKPVNFDRDLQSLLHLPDFKSVKGIVIGRFQKSSKMNDKILTKIIKTKKELDNLPIIANVYFGHTTPMITFPIGGEVSLIIDKNNTKLEIIKH